MTLTIELAPEVERVLERKAQERGVNVEQYLLELAQRDAQQQNAKQDAQHETAPTNSATTNGHAPEVTAEIAARLRALDALPTTNNRAGLPELDLSGSRSDVYGYTEREDAQL